MSCRPLRTMNSMNLLTQCLVLYGTFVFGVIFGTIATAYFLKKQGIYPVIPSTNSATASVVIWFTGLSGAGKTTISDRLTEKLRQTHPRIEHLDGDVIRHLFPRTGFTRKDRDDHIRRVAYLAASLEKHHVTVIASLISPYADSRAFARKICKNFIEVYIATPLNVCEKRDVKGLYAKARSGKIDHFTGIDEPYEAPQFAEITIDTTAVSVEDAVDQIMDFIQKK